ncbi:hypothetical protein CVD28_02880 [Bacillus sp. M6-12]|uniref:hypothetical protein n=1 Tax=Bacillus sp. M6-12 TaxID=2054166 RepID=UPI000C76B674|nr:hypothetical protein [Bacillus sp. M6-12]PLS19376.1 hypothetical protein CVD28_02880 [Bacillus sp. M6-12]
MNLEEGKNYKLINKVGVSYDLYNPSLGKDYPIRVYGKYDLLVNNDTRESPSDFWIVMPDIDGTTFAQPIDGDSLAIKLMTLAFVPIMKEMVDGKSI